MTFALILLADLIFAVLIFCLIYRALNKPVKVRPSTDTKAIVRCMRFAAAKGFDPYNSHTIQARCFRMQAGRVR